MQLSLSDVMCTCESLMLRVAIYVELPADALLQVLSPQRIFDTTQASTAPSNEIAA